MGTRLTSLEACERLLCEAIRGHYLGQDELAVHVVASSAFHIAHDLVRHDRADRDTMGLVLSADPKLKKQYWDALRYLYNFLRHAGKDNPREIELEEVREENYALITLGAFEYYSAGGRRNVLTDIILVSYFTLHPPRQDLASKLPPQVLQCLQMARAALQQGFSIERLVRDLTTDDVLRAEVTRQIGSPYM